MHTNAYISIKCIYTSKSFCILNQVTWIENYTMEILDGSRMCSQWTVVSGGSYLLRSQQMTTTEGQAFYPRFRAVVYGTGQGESYLYRAASGDRPLICSFNPIEAGPAEEHDCPSKNENDH